MRVHIVEGNSKLGKTPNISTLPVVDCGKDLPCAGDCYARKFLFRPTVRRAWEENSFLQRHNPGYYWQEIARFLARKKPGYFRIHVAGDFVDQGCLDEWIGLAQGCPETNFLAFTKRFELDYEGLPDNLAIRFSPWPCWGEWERTFFVPELPRTWMFDPKHPSFVPADAYKCPGNCESCRVCWSRKVRHVVIEKH